ncbi:MAG: CAP domain-containing protein [Chitinophagaceae bacterium]
MSASFSARMSFLICFIFIVPLPSWSLRHPSPQVQSTYSTPIARMEDEILTYVNDYRGKKGLPVLQMNSDISGEALKHSVDMATNKVAFGHDGFEDRVKMISKKIGNMHSSAENVAYGNLSPKEVVDIWLKSAGHRKNIEGRYTLTGIGTATDKSNIIFFTQIFVSK